MGGIVLRPCKELLNIKNTTSRDKCIQSKNYHKKTPSFILECSLFMFPHSFMFKLLYPFMVKDNSTRNKTNSFSGLPFTSNLWREMFTMISAHNWCVLKRGGFASCLMGLIRRLMTGSYNANSLWHTITFCTQELKECFLMCKQLL